MRPWSCLVMVALLAATPARGGERVRPLAQAVGNVAAVRCDGKTSKLLDKSGAELGRAYKGRIRQLSRRGALIGDVEDHRQRPTLVERLGHFGMWPTLTVIDPRTGNPGGITVFQAIREVGPGYVIARSFHLEQLMDAATGKPLSVGYRRLRWWRQKLVAETAEGGSVEIDPITGDEKGPIDL